MQRETVQEEVMVITGENTGGRLDCEPPEMQG